MEKFQLNTVIIDNEVATILELIDLLNIYSSINIVGTATNLDEGIELIKITRPNIVFLDIDMPHKCGLDIFYEFKAPYFKIIFCSYKKEHSFNSLVNHNCEFLSKPLDIYKIEESLQKVHEELLQEQYLYNLDKTITNQITTGILKAHN